MDFSFCILWLFLETLKTYYTMYIFTRWCVLMQIHISTSINKETKSAIRLFVKIEFSRSKRPRESSFDVGTPLEMVEIVTQVSRTYFERCRKLGTVLYRTTRDMAKKFFPKVSRRILSSMARTFLPQAFVTKSETATIRSTTSWISRVPCHRLFRWKPGPRLILLELRPQSTTLLTRGSTRTSLMHNGRQMDKRVT